MPYKIDSHNIILLRKNQRFFIILFKIFDFFLIYSTYRALAALKNSRIISGSNSNDDNTFKDDLNIIDELIIVDHNISKLDNYIKLIYESESDN